MTAIEKTGEISIAAVRDLIGLVSKVPRVCENSHVDNYFAEIDPQASGAQL